MSDRVIPAFIALIAGAVVAVLLFVPFVASEYGRHGRLTPARLLTWGASVVYAMALWTYTLLPLPDPATIRCAGVQLRPGQFVADILSYDVSSVGALLRNPAVQQVVLNVLLFLPLGLFLRALWGRGILAASAAALALSALIEVTQLTGLYGIYPCAYRVFDVDDLLANTLGGFLGAIAARLLIRTRGIGTGRTLPSEVTRGRRLTAMACDALTTWLMAVATGIAANAVQLFLLGVPRGELADVSDAVLLVPLVLHGLVAVATGRTIGDHAAHIRYAPGFAPVPLQGVVRYAAGIGGFQALGFLAPFDLAFAAVSVILVFVTADGRGLPGMVMRRPLEVARR
ncbi:VanZ family protein [Microbacterium album]|uniref:VanZ-like domain-containing protein n=1 Tax=Microbacterium album TaxID=2053191 RepID=A0A917IFS1_9MICO|nr:VanZ family protein [Microbacterium album]GGH48970.1 hypothetical protein GCM10010921_26830 [Microbacterium album]